MSVHVDPAGIANASFGWVLSLIATSDDVLATGAIANSSAYDCEFVRLGVFLPPLQPCAKQSITINIK